MVAVRFGCVRWLVLAGSLAGPAWGQVEVPPEPAEPVLLALAPSADFRTGPVEQELPRRPAARLSLTATTPLHTFGAPPTGLDVGLQWRQPLANNQAVDITAWRRVNQQPDAMSLIEQREPLYGARVEMKIAPRRSGFTTDYKFIGLQLESGAKIGLRRKDGRPTVYYRAQF
ncbi:MAG TPA: hypothetical protein VEA40_19200 [Ramlibacter sp.]|nr:hypothetical protein [Ramlibacter sp.]